MADTIKTRSFQTDDRDRFDVVATLEAEGHCSVQAHAPDGRAFGPKVEITATNFDGTQPAPISLDLIDHAIKDVGEQVIESIAP